VTGAEGNAWRSIGERPSCEGGLLWPVGQIAQHCSSGNETLQIYLCAIKDVYSKKIVGYSIDSMDEGVSAFVEDLVETARRLAARSAGARLDPPLLLALDEIGNLAPLPSLPNLMAEGGGTGITTMPVLQSLAQARTKWSENAAGTIWDSSIVKVVLGGASNSRDLHDLSTVIGERDESTDSTTVGDRGSRSAQRSIRRVPIMPPDTIRTLQFGTGLIMLRSAPPVIASLQMWTARPDAKTLLANRADIEALMRRPPWKQPAKSPVSQNE
jgi:type IV secretion system protein VirD4